jgi:hypothetical protein
MPRKAVLDDPGDGWEREKRGATPQGRKIKEFACHLKTLRLCAIALQKK